MENAKIETEAKVKNNCRCCVLEYINTDRYGHLLSMKNEAFIHQHQIVSFVDAFSHVNNQPADIPLVIPIFDIKICESCVVLLESTYVFRKICENAEQLFQHYCHCCKIENVDKNIRFFNMNTEVFEHNQKSISFTEGFSAVNNYSVEDADKILDSKTSICENCAFLLQNAYTFQKMCQAATFTLQAKFSTPTSDTNQSNCELNQQRRQNEGQPRTVVESFSQHRTLRSHFKTCQKVDIVEKTQPQKLKIDQKLPIMKLHPKCESRIQIVINSYRCKKCPKKLKSKIGLETHRRIKHREVQSIRDLYLRVRKQQPVLHGMNQHPILRYSCQDCHNTFVSKYRVLKHIQSVHLKMKNPIQKKNYRFDCEICEASFTSKQNLGFHIDNVHKKLRYRCEKCPKIYQKKDSLKNHYQCEHMNKSFACQDCGKIYKTPGNLSLHRRSEHLKTMLNCKQCSLAYTNPATLRKHIQSEHQTRHACQDCDKVYKRAQHLHSHKLDAHLKRVSECQYCSKKFTARSNLLAHITYHHRITEYKCDECSKIYKKRYILKKHMESAHQNLKHACTECDKKYIEKSTLDRHFQIVHLKKPLECIKCPEKFKNIYHLKKHVASQHMGKEFSCKFCKQVYANNRILKLHIKNIHDHEQYPCDKCSKVYKHKPGLYRHQQSKHQNKKWPCKSCPKVFTSSSGLTNHNDVWHLKLLRHCKKCPAAYKTNNALRKHFESEHLNNTYPCEYCPKKFTSSVGYRKHKSAIHPKVLHPCGMCSKKFKSPKALSLHINRNTHEKEKAKTVGKRK